MIDIQITILSDRVTEQWCCILYPVGDRRKTMRGEEFGASIFQRGYRLTVFPQSSKQLLIETLFFFFHPDTY